MLTDTYANAEELVHGFRAEDISGLKLGLSHNEETKLLESALKKFKLTLLGLSGAQWSKANVKLLHLLRPHSYLLVDTWRATGRNTFMLPNLPNVDTLAMVDCNVVFANLFENPDQAPCKTLNISKSSLSKEDLVHASRWPNLNTIILDSSLSSASLMQPLLEANQIKRIVIKQERLNLDDLVIKSANKAMPPRQKTIIFEGLPVTRENVKKIYHLKKQFSNIEVTGAKARTVDLLPPPP